MPHAVSEKGRITEITTKVLFLIRNKYNEEPQSRLLPEKKQFMDNLFAKMDSCRNDVPSTDLDTEIKQYLAQKENLDIYNALKLARYNIADSVISYLDCSDKQNQKFVTSIVNKITARIPSFSMAVRPNALALPRPISLA